MARKVANGRAQGKVPGGGGCDGGAPWITARRQAQSRTRGQPAAYLLGAAFSS